MSRYDGSRRDSRSSNDDGKLVSAIMSRAFSFLHHTLVQTRVASFEVEAGNARKMIIMRWAGEILGLTLPFQRDAQGAGPRQDDTEIVERAECRI